MKTKANAHLVRCEILIIDEKQGKSLESASDAGGGPIRCHAGYAGRPFNIANNNFGLVEQDLYLPTGKGAVHQGYYVNERFRLNNTDVVTGNNIYGEGRTHFYTEDGNRLVDFREAMHADPEFAVGNEAWNEHGGPGFVTKEFDNAVGDDLGHHGHLTKTESYNFNKWRNRRYKGKGYTTYGFTDEMDVERLTQALREFYDGKVDNKIRRFARHHLKIEMGTGATTECMVAHGPAGGVCTEEIHPDEDGYFFIQNNMPSVHGLADRSLLTMEVPKDVLSKGRDTVADWLATRFKESNWDPQFLDKWVLKPVRDDENCADGFHIEWRVYGHADGAEKYSLKQFELAPGKSVDLAFPRGLAAVFFQNGFGKFGKQDVDVQTFGNKVGAPVWDEFIVPYGVTSDGDCEITLKNKSRCQPLVGTIGWGPGIWGDKLPRPQWQLT